MDLPELAPPEPAAGDAAADDDAATHEASAEAVGSPGKRGPSPFAAGAAIAPPVGPDDAASPFAAAVSPRAIGPSRMSSAVLTPAASSLCITKQPSSLSVAMSVDHLLLKSPELQLLLGYTEESEGNDGGGGGGGDGLAGARSGSGGSPGGARVRFEASGGSAPLAERLSRRASAMEGDGAGQNPSCIVECDEEYDCSDDEDEGGRHSRTTGRTAKLLEDQEEGVGGAVLPAAAAAKVELPPPLAAVRHFKSMPARTPFSNPVCQAAPGEEEDGGGQAGAVKKGSSPAAATSPRQPKPKPTTATVSPFADLSTLPCPSSADPGSTADASSFVHFAASSIGQHPSAATPPSSPGALAAAAAAAAAGEAHLASPPRRGRTRRLMSKLSSRLTGGFKPSHHSQPALVRPYDIELGLSGLSPVIQKGVKGPSATAAAPLPRQLRFRAAAATLAASPAGSSLGGAALAPAFSLRGAVDMARSRSRSVARMLMQATSLPYTKKPGATNW
jgi:hypothetical protein